MCLAFSLLVMIIEYGSALDCCGEHSDKTKHIPTQKPITPPHKSMSPTSFALECADIIDNIPLLPDVDPVKMLQTCRSRFKAITKNMHAINQADIKNWNLLIIDLDEAIVDQRTFYMHRNQTESEILKHLNENDLVYNFHQLTQSSNTDPRGLSFRRRVGDIGMAAIFRKDLMKFIGFVFSLFICYMMVFTHLNRFHPDEWSQIFL